MFRIKVYLVSQTDYLPIFSSEHRAVMEAAFVYGPSYQFALTTEVALLEDIGYVMRSPGQRFDFLLLTHFMLLSQRFHHCCGLGFSEGITHICKYIGKPGLPLLPCCKPLRDIT